MSAVIEDPLQGTLGPATIVAALCGHGVRRVVVEDFPAFGKGNHGAFFVVMTEGMQLAGASSVDGAKTSTISGS